MAKQLSTLSIILSMSPAGVRQGAQQASESLRGFGRDVSAGRQQVGGFGLNLSALLPKLVAAGAALLSVRAAWKATMETIARGAEIQALSDRLGIGAVELQRLRAAVEDTGGSASAVDTSLRRMMRGIADARAGSGPAAEALRILGLEADELAKLSPDRMFERLSDAIAGVQDPAEQLRIAFQLFDVEGAQLLPLMRQGADGVRRLGDEAERTGQILSADQAAAAAEADAALRKLSRAWEGFKTQLSIAVIPALGALVDILAVTLSAVNAVIKPISDLIFTLTGGGRASDQARNSLAAMRREAEMAAVAMEGLEDSQEQLQTSTRNLAGEAERLKESLRTPMERLQDDLQHVQSLWSEGLLSAETYRRAVEGIREEVADLAREQLRLPDLQAPARVAAVEVGTAAATVAVQAARDEAIRRQREHMREQAIRRRQAELLEEIANNTRGSALTIREVGLAF